MLASARTHTHTRACTGLFSLPRTWSLAMTEVEFAYRPVQNLEVHRHENMGPEPHIYTPTFQMFWSLALANIPLDSTFHNTLLK